MAYYPRRVPFGAGEIFVFLPADESFLFPVERFDAEVVVRHPDSTGRAPPPFDFAPSPKPPPRGKPMDEAQHMCFDFNGFRYELHVPQTSSQTIEERFTMTVRRWPATTTTTQQGPQHPVQQTSQFSSTPAAQEHVKATPAAPSSHSRAAGTQGSSKTDKDSLDSSSSDDGSDVDEDVALLEDEGNLNVTYKDQIDWIKYVDVLPEAHSMAPGEQRRPRTHRVSTAQRTVYRIVLLSAEEQDLIYRTFTSGWFTCDYQRRGVLTVTLSPSLELMAIVVKLGDCFPEGQAALAFEPVAHNEYASQPKSATPESSYILNRYRIKIATPSRSHVIDWEPLGQTVNWMWDDILRPLAQVVSIRRNEAIIYGYPRYPSEDNGWPTMELPGGKLAYAEWGASAAVDNDTTRATNTGKVELRDESLRSGTEERDIILSIVGAVIFYAIRPRFGEGRTRPIQSDEWKPLTASIVDDWVICYLVSLCLITRVCLKARLMRPSGAGPAAASVRRSGESRGARRRYKQQWGEGSFQLAIPFRFPVIRD